jgi:hypothetical protein
MEDVNKAFQLTFPSRLNFKLGYFCMKLFFIKGCFKLCHVNFEKFFLMSLLLLGLFLGFSKGFFLIGKLILHDVLEININLPLTTLSMMSL